MDSVRRIVGVGAGAFTGWAVVSPYLRSCDFKWASLAVLLAMAISSSIGGLVPWVAMYAGIGVVLNLTIGVGTEHFECVERWWLVLPVLGAFLGFLHLWYSNHGGCNYVKASRPLSITLSARDSVAEKTARASRCHDWGRAFLALSLGLAIGTILELALGGRPLLTQFPVFFGLGALIGIALFFGFAASAILGHRRGEGN